MASVPGQGMASSFFRICSKKLRVVTEAEAGKPQREKQAGRHPAVRLREGEQ